MMSRRLVFLCALQFFACVARAEQEAPATGCDRYAASDFGQIKSGISFEKIDPIVAIPACEEAVRTYPGSTRLVFQLGRSYLKSGDFDAALGRFRQASEEGYPPALNAIGTMYSDGSGVPKDESKAVNWYRKAAERGYIGGQLNLGFMYENGRGVPQDYVAALEWYRKAADQGSAPAQDSIGYFYSQGMGVKRDDAEAVAWFRKAAEQGMAGAQYNLAAMYEKGLGVPEGRYQALAWYRKSADQGNEDAKKKLIALGTEENANAPYPPDMTRLKKQAAASCRYSSEQDIEDCYVESLKRYRGHPQDLTRGDLRDAVAYCSHAGESNDSQFCADLHNRFSALFVEELRERIESAARERQRRKAEEAKKPKFVAVTARGVSVVPGAIVCPNHDTVSLIFDLYVAHWTDTLQDVLTNGQSRLLRGQPTPAPDLKSYGCALLSPGTPMMLERGNIVPVVTSKLPDGTTIRGVTLGAMIAGQ
jgi:TPR repeat protein